MASPSALGVRFAATAAALLLSGCWWTGPVLYAPVPNGPAPLADGRYRRTNVEAGKPSSEAYVRLHRLADGSFAGEEEGEASKSEDATTRLTFAPLALPGRSLWITEAIVQGDARERVAIYGLAEAQGAVLTMDPALECNGNEDLVRQAGGRIRSASRRAAGEATDHECVFADRPSLERALTAYASLHPRLTRSTWERVGD